MTRLQEERLEQERQTKRRERQEERLEQEINKKRRERQVQTEKQQQMIASKEREKKRMEEARQARDPLLNNDLRWWPPQGLTHVTCSAVSIPAM